MLLGRNEMMAGQFFNLRLYKELPEFFGNLLQRLVMARRLQMNVVGGGDLQRALRSSQRLTMD